MKTAHRFIVAGFMLLVGACSQQPTVSALFDGEVAVAAGADVIYQGNVVGEVDRVAREGSGSRVHMSMDAAALDALKKESAAQIVNGEGASALEIHNNRAGKTALADGDELVALHNAMEYVAWQAGEAVGFTQDALSAAATSVQDYFSSEEWLQQKQAVQQSLEQLQAGAQTAMSGLGQEFDSLVKELENQSDESRQKAQQHYEQLTGDLQEQLGQYLQEGETALAESIEQFMAMLEQLMEKYSGPRQQRTASGAAV